MNYERQSKNQSKNMNIKKNYPFGKNVIKKKLLTKLVFTEKWYRKKILAFHFFYNGTGIQ